MSYGRRDGPTVSTGTAITIVVIVIVACGALAIMGTFLKRLDPGNVGVMVDYGAGTTTGQPSISSVQTGQFVWVGPLQRLAEYPIAQQTLSMVRREEAGQVAGDDSVDCRDKSGIRINIDSSTLWRVDPSHAGDLYLLRPDFPLTGAQGSIEADIVRREVRSAVAFGCSGFKYDEIYATRRVEFGQVVSDYLFESLGSSYLLLDGFILGEVYLPAEQQEAVDRKARAEQAAQEAAFLAEKARNEAAANIATAEGDRQIAILQAQAQAEAVKIINEQLAQSEFYIAYLYAQNWNGVLPTTLVISDGESFPLLGAIGLEETSVTPPAPTPPTDGNQ